MRLKRTPIAMAMLALLVTTGCGQATASSPSSSSYSGTVRELHVSDVGGSTTTEWYATNGPWSTSPGPGVTVFYDGNAYIQKFDSTYRVLSGDPGYVRAASIPFVEIAPGVAIMHAYDAGELTPANTGGKVKVQKRSDGTVTISLPIESDTDTSSTTVQYHIVADPPVSFAQARARGAFRIPKGTPNETETAGAPGSASTIGMPAYWFGPKLQNRTARVSVQILKTTSKEDDIGNPREYRTIYRTASIPSAGTVHGYAAYPGVGDNMTGDVEVDNLLNTERTEVAPGSNETGRTATPVTLTDGEHAMLYTWDNPAISPGGGSFVVRVGKVTVEANYIGVLPLATVKQLVTQLRPVG